MSFSIMLLAASGFFQADTNINYEYGDRTPEFVAEVFIQITLS